MMLTAINNLLTLAMALAGLASVSVLANEVQNSVLPRMGHPVRCGLHSRVWADHRPPKSGVYTYP